MLNVKAVDGSLQDQLAGMRLYFGFIGYIITNCNEVVSGKKSRMEYRAKILGYGMEQESRIEQIFEALKNKVPVTQINESLDRPQVSPVSETGQQSDMERKVFRVLSGLQIVESVEEFVAYGSTKGINEADLIVRTKREDEHPAETLTIIIRPGRSGIRRYRRRFGNTYNLGPDQIDEYLRLKRIILIRGRAENTAIENEFLRKLKDIQEYQGK